MLKDDALSLFAPIVDTEILISMAHVEQTILQNNVLFALNFPNSIC